MRTHKKHVRPTLHIYNDHACGCTRQKYARVNQTGGDECRRAHKKYVHRQQASKADWQRCKPTSAQEIRAPSASRRAHKKYVHRQKASQACNNSNYTCEVARMDDTHADGRTRNTCAVSMQDECKTVQEVTHGAQ